MPTAASTHHEGRDELTMSGRTWEKSSCPTIPICCNTLHLMGIYLSVTSTKHTSTSILWPCQAAAKPPGLQGPRNIKQLQGVNSQLEPLCSTVGSTAAGGKSHHGSSVLLFPVKGAFGGWPVVGFHSTQAYTKLLKGKGQANKPYRLSQILTTGHLLSSCQVKCRMFSSCLGPGGG